MGNFNARLQLIVVALFLAVIPSLADNVAQGVCGTGVNWSLDDQGVLTIGGEGEMNNFTNPTNTNATLPSWNPWKSKIKRVVIEGGVAFVGNYAFYEYDNLEDVAFGEGVKRLGNRVFFGCTGLKKLELPESMEQIGDAWTNYSDYGATFCGCSGITELTVPTNMKFLAANSFTNTKIEKINWNAIDCDADVVSYSNYEVFGYCPIREVYFGDKVKSVPAYIFAGRGSLATVKTSGTIEYVGANAFRGTSWLGAQELDKMIYLDHAAYQYSQDTQTAEPISFEFPEGTKSITASAFQNNKLLVKVTIPHSMDRIGENVFDGCSSLGEVVWNADSVNNDRCRFSKSLYKISIGDKVRVIPNYFLYQCTGLAEIKLPESVESIGESAFGECDGIKQFVIPNSVKTIGRIAISYCDNLEKVVVGEGLQSMNFDYLFTGCSKLKTLEWNAINHKEVKEDLYHQYESCQAPVENVIFGDKVEYVPGMLFFGVKTLENVKFGKSVKRIGEAAFRGCTGLTKVDFPDGIETIGDNAFLLTNIEFFFLPTSIKSVEGGIQTSNLKQVICIAKEAPIAYWGHNSDLKLYVPNTLQYSKKWYTYESGQIQPMIKADKETIYYTGKAPTVTFTSNIPGYELVSLTKDYVLNGEVGEDSVRLVGTFKGEKEFTVEMTYHYEVKPGKQEVTWEQDLSNLHVGDKVELTASVNTGREMWYVNYDNKVVDVKKEDGKFYLYCKAVGETDIATFQYGDEHWETSPQITKHIVVAEVDAGITDAVMTSDAKEISRYSANGQRLTAPTKGLNIVKYSDGSVRKEMVK